MCGSSQVRCDPRSDVPSSLRPGMAAAQEHVVEDEEAREMWGLGPGLMEVWSG